MHIVRFFNIGNADSCLIELENSRLALFDFADMRSKGDAADKRCDLEKELRECLGPVDVHRSRMMVAAMATKAEKLLSVLQHRMAIPLYSFSFPKKFSIR